MMAYFSAPTCKGTKCSTSCASHRDSKESYRSIASDRTPSVGRGKELDLHLRRWKEAKTGEGRVVMLPAGRVSESPK
jgi:hypothetical protein